MASRLQSSRLAFRFFGLSRPHRGFVFHSADMKLFGLTGGIGTGKSTAANLLAQRGVSVIDTDVIAREVVAPGQPALREVAAEFGASVLDSQGGLDRGALAKIVFGNESKRRLLESILHPRIRERWVAQVTAWRAESVACAVVVIPLLFETDAQSQFDAVLCTACSATTQRERLEKRGWSEPEIQQRISAQWSLDRKMAASRYVVWTEGTIEIHSRQLDRILSLPR